MSSRVVISFYVTLMALSSGSTTTTQLSRASRPTVEKAETRWTDADQTRCNLLINWEKKNVNRLALSETNDNSVFFDSPFFIEPLIIFPLGYFYKSRAVHPVFT